MTPAIIPIMLLAMALMGKAFLLEASLARPRPFMMVSLMLGLIIAGGTIGGLLEGMLP